MDKFGNEGRVRYGSSSDPVQSGRFKSGSVRYGCKLRPKVLKILGQCKKDTPLGLAGTFLLLLPVPGICETKGYKTKYEQRRKQDKAHLQAYNSLNFD